MSWSISALRVRLVPLNILSPQVIILLTVPRHCLFCWSLFVSYGLCLSLLCSVVTLHVCTLQTCGHLLRNGWPLDSLVLLSIYSSVILDPESFVRGGSTLMFFFFFFFFLMREERIQTALKADHHRWWMDPNRGGPTLTTFLGDGWIQKPLKSGHHRAIIGPSFKWRFAGGPMMAQHWMLAW